MEENYFKGLAKFLVEYVQDAKWVLLTLTTLLACLLLLNVYPGYVFVTVGRVTVRVDNPLNSVSKLLAVAVSTLSILLLFLEFGYSSRNIGIFLSYTVLFSTLTLFNETLVAIPSIIVVGSIAVSSAKGKGMFKKVLNGFIYLVASIELLALTHRLLLVLGFRNRYLSALAYFEMCLWSLLWFTTPLALLTFLAVFVLRKQVNCSNITKDVNNHEKVSTTRPWVFVALALSMLMSIVGYLPTVNPNSYPLNVDWIYYYNALQKLSNSSNVLRDVFTLWNGDRPLYLLTLYLLFKSIPIDLKALCIYHNVALIMFYTFSVYFLTKKIFGERVALIASLITPASPQVISFLYGGYQANLFALSLAQIALGIMYSRDSRSLSLKDIALIVMLSSLIRLSHLYTWTLFAFMTFLAISINILTICIRKRSINNLVEKLLELTIPMMFLLTGFAIDFILGYLGKDLNLSTITKAMNMFLTSSSNTLYSRSYWALLELYFNVYTGGSLNIPFYWVLYAIAVAICRYLSVFTLSYIVFPALFSLLILAVNPGELMYRVLINTPSVILVAKLLSELGLHRETKSLLALSILSFYSIALGKILSFVPGLQP